VEDALSTWEPHALRCPICGHTTAAPLLKGMHITRLPEVKAAIRAGTFQLVPCGQCGALIHVEKPSIYTDFDAGHYVGIELAGATDWREGKDRHRKVYDQVFLLGPPIAAELATRTLHRVVFGLRALREKVLAWDAGLDDAVVEVAKLEILKRGAIRFTDQDLRLVAVLPPGDHLLFARYARPPPGPPRRPRVIGHELGRRDWFDSLLARRAELREAYPWVFDDWFVDATHRLLHPG
jgi:hypothetical protein